jgi:hypothetical protein
MHLPLLLLLLLPPQVQQSFMLLNASVESYLAAIPPKYNRAARA